MMNNVKSFATAAVHEAQLKSADSDDEEEDEQPAGTNNGTGAVALDSSSGRAGAAAVNRDSAEWMYV